MTALNRSLRQALHFAVDYLDRPVDQPFFDTFFEDQVERSCQVFEVRLGKALRQRKVHQVADFDRLAGALVSHLTSRIRRLTFDRSNAASDGSGCLLRLVRYAREQLFRGSGGRPAPQLRNEMRRKDRAIEDISNDDDGSDGQH